MNRLKLFLLVGALCLLLIPATALASVVRFAGDKQDRDPGERYRLEGYTLNPHEKWTTGCVMGWAEWDTVPFRFVIENAEPSTQYFVRLWFDYERDSVRGIEDLTDGARFTIDHNPDRMQVENATIDSVHFKWYVFEQNVLKGEYWVWFTATGDPVTVEWRDLLGIGSSLWPGATVDTRMAWQGPPHGERTVPIMVVPGGPGWQPGTICGGKFYDANLNGVWDDGDPTGEPGIAGWLIKLFDASGTYLIDSTFTDSTGHYCFYNLAPDTYLVREVIPPPPPLWVPTTPTEYKVGVEDGGLVEGVDFGNVWLAPIGARTIGYWKNHPEAITEEMYAELCQLPAFIGIDTFEEVYEILDPPWHSMAEKLRAQLLAMTLNVLSGYVPGDAMVYLGWDVLAATLLFGDPPPMGATAQQILDAVEANYPWDHWNKDEQEAVKDLLDAMNNDERFVSPVPPPVSSDPGCGGTKGTAPRSHLLQNHPNPFASATTISYHLPAAASVSLKVYDNSGRLVRTLVNGIEQRGLRTIEWNGRDNDGREVSSGVYFYRLISGDSGQTGKMVVLR